MTSRERVLCALRGGEPDRVPFAEPTVAANVARALLGRSDEAWCRQGELSARMGRDIVVFFCNPPFFVEWQYGGSGAAGSARMVPLIRDERDLESMRFPDLDDALVARMRAFVAEEREDYAAVGASRLGLSAAIASMGTAEFCIRLIEAPDFVREVLRRYGEWVRGLFGLYAELGFDVVWVFDDFAFRSGPLFSPAILRDLILPALRPQAEAIELPWVFHSDGNLLPVLDDLLTLGMSGIHPIEPESMSLAETKRALAGRACAIGNVAVDTLSRGTPQQTRQAVRDAMAAGAPGGGYMISSSNSIPSYAQVENVQAMIDEIGRLCEQPPI